MLSVFGYDHARTALCRNHPSTNVRVPVENILPRRGAGSRSRRAASGRGASTTACGPWRGGRGAGRARCAARPSSRVAFGKRIADQSIWHERIADARIDIEMTRLLCLKAADMMDKAGNKTRAERIAMIRCRPRAWRWNHRSRRFGSMAAAGSQAISSWRAAGPTCAPALPIGPMKCTDRAIISRTRPPRDFVKEDSEMKHLRIALLATSCRGCFAAPALAT